MQSTPVTTDGYTSPGVATAYGGPQNILRRSRTRAAENSPGTSRCSRRTYNESIDELAAFEKSAKNRVDMMAVIDTEADDTHVDALDMHGATLAVDTETNRFELSQ